jgi:hypothetical protein
MATVDCGNLHIRTPETDSSLSPNNIIQSITNLGLRIGIIPESSVSDMKDFIITIKNNANNIIFQNSIPIPQSFYGDYIFVTIPFSVIPKINEVISIKIVGTTGCVFTKNYTILSYSSLSVFKPAISPFVKPTDKYIKITPTLTQYGFISGSSYFFKCDKNTDSDDNCLTQFNNNTDLSKIISFLPYGTTIADCIDSDDWVYVDTVCVQSGLLPTTSTTVLPVSSTPTLSTVSASNLTYSGILTNSIIKLYKDDVYTNQSITATSDGIWNGLSLISGVYKITSSESNKSESAKSNAITFNVTTAGSVTATPTLNSVNANSVTYSSYTTGTTLKLYNNGVYTNLSFVANSGTWSGLTLTTGTYTITATDSSKTESSKSNSISFNQNSDTRITEPNKSQYFFSDGNSPSHYNSSRAYLPSIIQNSEQYHPTDDIVYIENNYVKYGINLKRGGQLCYASLSGSTDNLIFNGYDGGFQVVLDATQILNPAQYKGQNSYSPQNNTAYNTTMGGTHANRSQTLMDYHRVGANGYYVKFRPLLYPFNDLIAEVEIGVTYTLVDRALKIEYTYDSFRTDGQYPANPQSPQDLKGWAIPISFLIEKLNRYQVYTGSATSAWTNSPVEDGVIPNTTQEGASILGRATSEFWGLSYNQTDNVGFGSMNFSEGGTEASLRWEQREKYAGNPQGGVFSGGRTVMDLYTSVLVPNGSNFQKMTTAYVSVGTPAQIRATFYTVSGH